MSKAVAPPDSTRQFVAELDVYSQSKGRTPNVFVFNPFAEGYIAHGKSIHSGETSGAARARPGEPAAVSLPADDIVLVPKRPSMEFLSGIKQAGFPLPEFVELKNGRIDREQQSRATEARPFASVGVGAGQRGIARTALCQRDRREAHGERTF